MWVAKATQDLRDAVVSREATVARLREELARVESDLVTVREHLAEITKLTRDR